VSLAACAAWPSIARADDAATAQALFDEATALKDKEQWAEACPKFESSYKLDPALGTLLNLANCYEKLGKIASAWARWEEAYQWALKNHDDRLDYAQKNRDALVPRLPKLKIVVTSRAPALSIERDTAKISEAMYGSALPVDPGEHSVFVKRGDEVLKTEKVKVVEAQSAEISLDLAAIEKAAPPPKPKKDVVVVGPSPALRKVGWAVGGVGVGGVLAAAALGTIALSKKGQADLPQNCFDKYCTPAGLALVKDARTFADAGQWVGIGSLVVVAVGVTLLIVTPSQVVVNDGASKDRADARPPRVWAAPWVAPEAPAGGGAPQTAFGLAVGGRL
jgi:tetratricopeptide (TPR) repeat protein